jgi:hypothetical protein
MAMADMVLERRGTGGGPERESLGEVSESGGDVDVSRF